jgi:hypothetical protein
MLEKIKLFIKLWRNATWSDLRYTRHMKNFKSKYFKFISYK